MTDAEIVKAYELCFTEKGTTYTCAICPYHSFGELCKVERDKDALDLINRQKAEIKLLRKANDEGLNSCLSVMSYFHEEQAVFAKRFYNAGIKEFAERLKDYYIKNRLYDRPDAHTKIAFLFGVIKNLVKEMAGDTE